MAITEQEAIQRLWDLGHFANPAKADTFNVEEKDLGKLRLEDEVVRQAIASYQDFMAIDGDRLSLDHHGRPMIHDGDVGPATKDLLEIERCGNPDYYREPLPAVGTGGWARCHDIGNFHAAKVKLIPSGMPSWMTQQVFRERIWPQVVAAYDEIGLHWILVDSGFSNTTLEFVSRSSGWIGLAIVGRGQGCNDEIWSRYLATYTGGSSLESKIQQWVTLIKHELGHNSGLGHSRGGVMNPSIINGLPVSWKNDPSESQLRKWYGGEPVPGGNPLPPDTPQPPTGGGDIPRVSLTVTVPEGFKPGTYNLVGTRFEGV
jgi:hypothetical protein